MALLRLGFDAWDPVVPEDTVGIVKSFDAFREDILILAGHFDTVYVTSFSAPRASDGRFSAGGVLVARDMIVGSVFFGVETLLTEAHQPQHIEQILHTVLQGIGLAPDEARAIAFMPLPDIGPTSPCIFATLQSA